MNKVGDFLTCKKLFEIRYSSIPTYTIGKRYQIMYICKMLFYITNNSTDWEYTKNRSKEEILKKCTLWKPEFIDEYFINITEERKQKISKIKKLYE